MQFQDVVKIIELVLPHKIVDSDEVTILSKLWAGFISSAWLMFAGSLILMGCGNTYMEKFGPITISNSSLLFVLGAIMMLFTISRVGINKPTPVAPKTGSK
jgi:hypothetical protein